MGNPVRTVIVAALLGLLVQADSVRQRLLEAEDARARTPAEVAVLEAGLGSADTVIQRVAVRAVGRLEQPAWLGRLAAAFGSPAISVRLEAANALAQAAHRQGADEAFRMLRHEAAAHSDGRVQAALLMAAGRLQVSAALAPEAVEWLEAGLRTESQVVRAGAARGLYDHYRRANRGRSASEEAVGHLRSMLRGEATPESRRVAMLALLTTGRLDSATVHGALRDQDQQVRMLAAQAVRTHRDLPGRAALAGVAWRDSSHLARIEAIRAIASPGVREVLGCGPFAEALEDPSIHVQLLAIEALGAGCPPATQPVALLDRIAQEPVTAEAWHRPAAALHAMALADSARAAIRIGRFASSPVWWARAAAARSAGRLHDRALLERLAADPVDNVREAVLAAMATFDKPRAERLALAQLTRQDYQLLLTSARTLRGAALGMEVAGAALEALQRVTAERAETSRDTRLALLERIEGFGNPGHGAALRGYLRDFDPAVAARAAAAITRLTGEPAEANPAPLPGVPLPAWEELRGMTRATLVMAGGGRIELALDPELAPANVARFVAMARAGWFDGLTLHRVVPNFVVQGGSPGANEYAGGPEFTRDEVGGSHLRGTVGISTRGRDTGDGQIFINLVDNLRLDHDYTVIGRVLSGWDALDAIREGAVILRAELPGR